MQLLIVLCTLTCLFVTGQRHRVIWLIYDHVYRECRAPPLLVCAAAREPDKAETSKQQTLEQQGRARPKSTRAWL